MKAPAWTCEGGEMLVRGRVQAIAVMALAVSLAGCGGFVASPRSPLSNDDTAIAGLEAAYTPDEVLKCLRTSLDRQQPCRDTIAQALMAAIDIRYSDFELAMFDAHRYGGFGATLAQLGLTTAASVSGGAAARLLAALATGVTGAREAFEREVLAERTVVALQTSMQARRNEVAARIREGLRFDATVYPLGSALTDLFAYFRAGTLVGAVVGLGEAASDRSQRARDRLDSQVGLPSTRAPAPGIPETPRPAPGPGFRTQSLQVPPPLPPEEARIRACLRALVRDADPVRRAENRRQLQAEMVRQGLPATVGTEQFLALPQFDEPRRRVGAVFCPR
jgi:hypothetical protein